MILVNELLGVMARAGYTKAALAKELNMTPKTFHLKLKKGVFGSDEIDLMIKVLKLKDDEPMKIFFATPIT